ncbi:MAG: carboxylating nicotinate-nucleotide diphosphorylase, partial [Deltaproteobacteria bacterium]|nr:carboxylating nicotinate-nucleotide diphosphorylase [Deltaproteobacteria bacterium]
MFHDQLIVLALQEDIGHGDLTTESIVDKNLEATGTIQAQEDLIVCGIEVAGRVFHLLDPEIQFHAEVADGEKVQDEKVLARVSGSARKLLNAERIALNFLQRLSGIATTTSHYVELIRGTGAKVIDTRKTTPGLRDLEKYAVRCGGGRNHRFGLSDGILIKDNHLQIAGG